MPTVTPLAAVSFVLSFLLGFLFYAALYASIGAAVNTVQEAQNMVFPILVYLISGFVCFPCWQLALSLAILVLATFGVLVAAGRIYRVGILMYGKRPTFSELLRWVRHV